MKIIDIVFLFMIVSFLVGCGGMVLQSDALVEVPVKVSKDLQLSDERFFMAEDEKGKKVLGMMFKSTAQGNQINKLSLIVKTQNGFLARRGCSIEKSVTVFTDKAVAYWNQINSDNRIEINSHAYVGECNLGGWEANLIESIYLYNKPQ